MLHALLLNYMEASTQIKVMYTGESQQNSPHIQNKYNWGINHVEKVEFYTIPDQRRGNPA